MKVNWGIAAALVSIFVLATGCSAGEAGESDTSTGSGGAFTNKYFYGPWLPDMSNIVGMDIGGSKSGETVYTWRSNGKYCLGTSNNLCITQSNLNYTCPGSCANIRAIAIAKNTQHVFTWSKKADGTPVYSEGVSNNLRHYVNQQPFTIPAGFNIDQLVEAHISIYNSVHYTWSDGNGGLVHTAGTSNNATTGAQYPVNSHDPGAIVGIAQNAWGSMFTWYRDADRNVNVSWDDGDLSYPD